jgi:hypothetical protein
MTRRFLLTILFVILCLAFAVRAYPETTHGTVIDVGSMSVVMLAVRLPYVPETPAAIDYVQNGIGRTVWTSGSEWALLPLSSLCIAGERQPIGQVTVCPPRAEGGHMDACVALSTGVLPIYEGSPVTTECGSRRRVVRH